jgi:RNA polymerase sigma factor (sigma-70 family)
MDTDLTILQRYCQTGDPEVFSQLVERHAAMVYAVALRVTRNAADADDVTQDCFLELTRKAIKVRTSLTAWLHLTATHRARDLKRSSTGRFRAAQHAGQQAGTVTVDLESAVWKDIAPVLDEVLAELPEELRVPLIMHFLEGQPKPEVGKALGLSRPTVYRRIDEGLLALRQKMRARGVAPEGADLGASLAAIGFMPLPPALKVGLTKIGMLGLGHAIRSVPVRSARMHAMRSHATGMGAKLVVIAAAMGVAVIGALLVLHAPPPALPPAGPMPAVIRAAAPAPMAKPRPSPAWVDVTPAGIELANGAYGKGDNFGVQEILVDPRHPNRLYAFVCYQGVWASTDYGQSWSKVSRPGGPLDEAKPWGAAIAPDGSYLLASQGNGPHFTQIFKSSDGGVTWKGFQTPLDPENIDIDPDDALHVITSGHSAVTLAESSDGGQTWSDRGPMGIASSATYVYFLASSTILAVANGDNSPGSGTWRGVKTGSAWTWTRVSAQQHWNGSHQLFIDRARHAIYNGGAFGIFRSTDVGLTWTCIDVSTNTPQSGMVIGTPSTLWSSASYPNGNTPYFANLHMAPRTSELEWTLSDAPRGMTNGAKSCALTSDGTNSILVSGNWNAGIWRLIEPQPSRAADAPNAPTPNHVQ